jgi:hypothetical protein
MDKIDRITVGGGTYELAPSELFYVGDSWDRSQEPAIYASADGSITFNCNADDIKIGSTSLSNAINGSSTSTYDAVATVNSAEVKIDSLESRINNLHNKVKELDERLDAALVDNRTSSPVEAGKAFAALAGKMKALQGKRTLEDLIEPGEPEWISKMNLKTRKVGEFKKAQLLTI